MSKIDRQGVRTPADVERKYDLSGLTARTQEAKTAAAEAKNAADEARQAADDAAAVYALVKDYIVEHGTIENWSYEKWSSGKAVCWRTTDKKDVSFSEALTANEYYAALSYSFPVGLFVPAPSFACVSPISSDGLLAARIGGISATSIDLFAIVYAQSAVTKAAQFMIEAKGKWKVVSNNGS